MREESSLIDQFSDSLDDMWANVLNEQSDDEDGPLGLLGARCASPPPSELDLQLDKSLSYVDEETIQGLGCVFDGLLLAMTPDEDELLAVKKMKPMPIAPAPIKPVSKRARNSGLPPRPNRKRATRPKQKPQTEKRQDTKEENESGFLSYMFSSTETEQREEIQEPLTNKHVEENSEDMDPVPLTRRISFRRVSSSFRRKESARTQSVDVDEMEDEDDEFFGDKNDDGQEVKEETNESEDVGFLSFMFGNQEGTEEESENTKESKPEPPRRKRHETVHNAANDDDDDNQSIFSFLLCADREDVDDTKSKSKNKATLSKKFARQNGTERSTADDESVAAGSLTSVRLVKRSSFRRERSGKRSSSLRTLQAERF